MPPRPRTWIGHTRSGLWTPCSGGMKPKGLSCDEIQLGFEGPVYFTGRRWPTTVPQIQVPTSTLFECPWRQRSVGVVEVAACRLRPDWLCTQFPVIVTSLSVPPPPPTHTYICVCATHACLHQHSTTLLP
jgi:hypothetical protein